MGETAVQPAPADVLPPADPTMVSAHLPTIDRSLQRPVWHDRGGGMAAKCLRGNDEVTPYVSTFTADYIKHALPVIHDLRGKASALVTASESAPFAAHTEHRDNFTAFLKPRARFRTRRGQIQIPQVPLEKESSYKKEFNQKYPERRELYRPREQDMSSSEPFCNTSIYRDSFKRWETLPAIGALPVIASAPLPPPEQEETADFNAERALGGATDYRGNFRFWPIQKSDTVPARYRPPKEPFACETSYGTDYGPRPQPKRTLAARPHENDLRLKGPFDGTSIYRDEYTKKEARPCSRDIHQNRYSLMYTANGSNGPEEWFKGAEMEPYLEHPLQVFYQAHA